MSHGGQQAKTEIRALHSSLGAARLKGGEARRNVDRISGEIESFDRPDILIRAGIDQVVGIEHFRVDQCIAHGKKRESKAAALSANADKLMANYREDALSGELPDAAYQEIGDLISASIRMNSNSCVGYIVESLHAGLFGEGRRGHVGKLDAYTRNLRNLGIENDISLGFLIEFHTDLEKRFLNDGAITRKVRHGEFPLSCEAYDLLKRASRYVDWLILSFCPLYTCKPVDAAVVDCRNGKFESSMRRQNLFGIPYLGLGKNEPFGRQRTQGCTEFSFVGDEVRYLIDNTSEPIKGHSMLGNAIENASKAMNFRRSGQSFVCTLPVQLCYELAETPLKSKGGTVSPRQVLEAILSMDPCERNARLESFEIRWGLLKRNS